MLFAVLAALLTLISTGFRRFKMAIIIVVALPSEGARAAFRGAQLRGLTVALMIFGELLDNRHRRPQGELPLELVKPSLLLALGIGPFCVAASTAAARTFRGLRRQSRLLDNINS